MRVNGKKKNNVDKKHLWFHNQTSTGTASKVEEEESWENERGSRNLNSRRGRSSETVQEAISKQLSWQSPISDRIRKDSKPYIPSFEHPSLLITHIQRNFSQDHQEEPVKKSLKRRSSSLSVPEREVRSSDGGRSSFPSSFSESENSEKSRNRRPSASPTMEDKGFLPDGIRGLSLHGTSSNSRRGKVETSRKTSLGLNYGPITSSIDDQMAGRRAQHRRAKQNGGGGGNDANGLLRLTNARPTTQHASRALPSVEFDFETTNLHRPATTQIMARSLSPHKQQQEQWLSGKSQKCVFSGNRQPESVKLSCPTRRESSSKDDDEMLDIDEDLGGEVLAAGFGSTINLKGGGKAIDVETASRLKCLLMGSATKVLPDGWIGQAFTFSPLLNFGLVQRKGGPCGILAVVQAFIIKFLLFQAKTSSLEATTKQMQQWALKKALTHILVHCSGNGGEKVTLALPGSLSHFHGFLGHYKADGLTETLNLYTLSGPASVENEIEAHIKYFSGQGNSSVLAFLYSLMLTRGIDNIQNLDMDTSESVLMGAHGYCSQEMVNLCLIGLAVSNTFDGDKLLGPELTLKGIPSRSEIGLLSLFEHYGSIFVGDNLKSPVYPIWLVCWESHFTVMYGLKMGLERTSAADRSKIQLYYYDQLSRMHEKPVNLTIDCLSSGHKEDKHLVSPIELCIKTKWTDADVDWNGNEPIL